MQIACQNRTMLSNAESRSLVRRFSTELLKGSKVSERKPILDSRTDQQTLGRWRPDRFRKCTGGTNPATPFLANVLRQLDMSERRGGGKRSRVAFVAAPNCSIKRNVLWNLKTTTLFGIPSSRTRSSFSNRNVLSAVFRC